MAQYPVAMETDDNDKDADVNMTTSGTSASTGQVSGGISGVPVINPLVLIQEKLDQFVGEIKTAEDDAKKMDKEHRLEQERLMKEFSQRSLQLMHKYNCQIKPIQSKLSNVKQPLVDVLLS